MIDLLVSLGSLLLLVAGFLLAAGGLTLVPFSLAVTMAEQRRFDIARWAIITGACILAGLASGYLVLTRSSLPDVLVLLPAVACWAGPIALFLLTDSNSRIGGVGGRHE